MDQIVECIPNFSEGRDPAIIQSIIKSIESVPGVNVLHSDMSYDAHRTVITYVGYPMACMEAAYRSIATATALIDMRLHHGAHPRIGAVDVFPFVPLHGISMQEVKDLTIGLGRRVGSDFNIPVYLYNQSAKRDDRISLANVRSGEYEGLANKLNAPDGRPDFGPGTMNEKSGALILGARKLLVAYNINLKTSDVGIAKRMARLIREKHGGLKAVRAIGWYMPEFKCAQVSTNLVDLEVTPMHLVFQKCVAIARDLGTEVTGSELVGLVPQKCLMDAVDYFVPENKMDDEAKIQMATDLLGLNSVKDFNAGSQILEKVWNE